MNFFAKIFKFRQSDKVESSPKMSAPPATAAEEAGSGLINDEISLPGENEKPSENNEDLEIEL